MFIKQSVIIGICAMAIYSTSVLAEGVVASHAEAAKTETAVEPAAANSTESAEVRQKLIDLFVAKCREGYLSSEKAENITTAIQETATKQCHCLATSSPIIDDMMHDKGDSKDMDVAKKYSDYIVKCATPEAPSEAKKI